MSTHYDIACLDCRTEAGVEFHTECRDKDALEHIVKNKTVFAELANLSYSYICVGGGRVETDWLREHLEHELRVLSCYEDVETLATKHQKQNSNHKNVKGESP
jgi:hypothetical protein